jgi:hypothetical protein
MTLDGRIPLRSADTTDEAERVQIDLFRAAPIGRRLHVALSLSADVIGAARRGLQRARPYALKRELDVWFAEVQYGCDLADDLRKDLARRDVDHRRPT